MQAALFYDIGRRFEQLSTLGDPLEKLDDVIPWGEFRKLLEKKLGRRFRNPQGGRPPYDVILMFKMLVLQTLFNISDDQAEYQVRDRLSFMRFLKLSIADTVPDSKTLWLFREQLTQEGLLEQLFEKFDRHLSAKGYKAKKGQIIDASIISVPKQRNSRNENKEVKQGKVPKEWKENPSRLQQKDTDARWTKKHGKSFYGYKNHISIDNKHKLVRKFKVTSAAPHDSQILYDILDDENTGADVWADSAYRSNEIEAELKKAGYRSKIQHKGKRNSPLSEAKVKVNHRRSKTRATVEHVFGSQEGSLGGRVIKTVGIVRAGVKIGMQNLVYNFQRFAWLERRNLSTA